MREIKYRAFIKKTKKMCQLWDIRFKAQEVCVEHKDTTFDFLDFEEVEIMQYTGLKDINGVEIYEGDIVQATYTVDGEVNKEPGIVEFKDFAFKTRVVEVDEYIDLSDYDVEQSNLEVVGNIFENYEKQESECFELEIIDD